jgi:hypothetical protein
VNPLNWNDVAGLMRRLALVIVCKKEGKPENSEIMGAIMVDISCILDNRGVHTCLA